MRRGRRKTKYEQSNILLEMALLPPRVREVIDIIRKEKTTVLDAYRRVYEGGDSGYKKFISRWGKKIKAILQSVMVEDVMLDEAKNVNWDWILAYCYSQVNSQNLDDKERVKILEIMVKALERKEKSSAVTQPIEDEL
jgi:hypothetical protein